MPPKENYDRILIRHNINQPYEAIEVEASDSPPNKTVTFSITGPKVEHIESRRELSKEEKGAMWYNGNQMDRNRVLNKKMVDAVDTMLEAGFTEALYYNDECVCMRGLEHLTKEQNPIYLSRRLVVQQKAKSIRLSGLKHDPDFLADFFGHHTAPSAVDARKKALDDEHFVFHSAAQEEKRKKEEASPVPLRRRSTWGTSNNSFRLSPRKRRVSTGKLLREEAARNFLVSSN